MTKLISNKSISPQPLAESDRTKQKERLLPTKLVLFGKLSFREREDERSTCRKGSLKKQKQEQREDTLS